jgi:hypothetical protein
VLSWLHFSRRSARNSRRGPRKMKGRKMVMRYVARAAIVALSLRVRSAVKLMWSPLPYNASSWVAPSCRDAHNHLASLTKQSLSVLQYSFANRHSISKVTPVRTLIIPRLMDAMGC